MRTSIRITGAGLALAALIGALQTPVAAQRSSAAAAAAAARAEQQPQSSRSTPAAAAPEQPAPAQTAPQASLTPSESGRGSFLQVENASLTEVVSLLARQLKINYIIDPRVKGAVSVRTYGELRAVDPRALLDTILRVNGAAMVQVGDLYRIVPLADAPRLPMRPQVNPESIPEDEQLSLNLVFLKYATVAELSKLLEKFLGEGATMITYDPANLLLLLDNNRSMRRTMELIALFDSDALASQRVRLFEVKNGSPTAIAKDLDTAFRSMSLGEKGSPVKFLPLDRINSVMAVSPNPGVFEEVEKWIQKLDAPVQVTAGSVDNYVYRVKYGDAQTLAMSIMQLYLGMQYGYGMYGGYGGYGGYSMGYGGYGMAYGGGAYGRYGAMGAGPAMGGAQNLRSNASLAAGSAQQLGQGAAGSLPQGAPGAGGVTSPFMDRSGYYMGMGGEYGLMLPEGVPRVVANPLNNTLLIQANPQEYEKILKLLRDMDIPPRQVLIEAKIYEVSLTGAFSAGVTSYLQRAGENGLGMKTTVGDLTTRTAQAAATSTGLVLTAGALVGRSRELLGILTAQETSGKTKVISAPVLLATDSIPAVMNVGQDVPTLSSSAATTATSSGSSLFANTISTRSSGVTLNVTARVNPSGVVTLLVDQEVSTPIPPEAGAAIQSPSFSTRTISTQVTVQDGDTVAIGGIIRESDTSSTAGVPLLSRIPVIGSAFGAKSTTRDRTELVLFITPRVIYDTNSVAEASEEIKSKLKRVTQIIKD
jgi:general secretion pathway protein D